MAAVHSIWSGIDEKATYEAAKQVLSEYQDWKLDALNFSLALKSPVMDDMPKSESFTNTNEEKLLDHSNAQFEVELRERTINVMRTIDDKHELLADLLYYRYIRNLEVKRVCQKLEAHYQVAMPERTYNDYLHTAVLDFAMIYPRKNIRKKFADISPKSRRNAAE